MDKSKGKYDICIGYVAEDKEYTSKTLSVYAPEILPAMDDYGDLTVKQTVKFTDAKSGLEFAETMAESNIIRAEYFDMATNRSGPPDMRQGEQVLLFHYADTDKYFWFPTGRDDNLRRLERFRLAVSNDSSAQKELNDDNTYFIEMDTLHSKRIRIQTSKSDGESYIYTIIVNSDTNTLTINDDIGNELIIESDIPRVRLKNSDYSFLDLFQKDVIIGAARDVIVKAGRQMVLASPTMATSVTSRMVMSYGSLTRVSANAVSRMLEESDENIE